MSAAQSPRKASNRRLNRLYAFYTLGFLGFVLILALLEQLGLPRKTMGYIFLLATVLLYAAIGIMSRTSDVVEYYVAGRRIPAMFNGMATGADWMSGASFVALAGGLYLSGYSGLAYVMGWTGGYVLVALLLAPYLRKFGQFTIPDFLGARYGGDIPRLLGIVISVLCSFTYVVAQIYAVGIITTRFTGVDFSVGIFLGLAGILVCSFLGGMKAVTWTQVAQYIVLIIAYLIPVVWLSIKQTGNPVPQLAYAQQLVKITQREEQLISDPRENEVRRIFAERSKAAARKLKDPARWFAQDRNDLEATLADAVRLGDAEAIRRAKTELDRYPTNLDAAITRWQREISEGDRAAPILRHAEAFPGRDEQSRSEGRLNFLALVFCLMAGTAALPHILMRYYTTPSVREARESVTWSLLFILLLYVTAPALAVLVKYVVYHDVVGLAFTQLPEWIQSWQRVDPGLLALTDMNADGIVQWAEITIQADIVMLATPEIGGLPYVISGLVAAGGLAASLSTADGLLLTMANALSHDLYYKMIDPAAPTARRVILSKMLLLVVAVLAAMMAAQKPGDILFLVSTAFSIAAAGFFPALVTGIFWKRATGVAAVLAMVSGLGLTLFYMVRTHPWLHETFGISTPIAENLWWGISPIAAGIFGVPLGFVVIIVVSLFTRRPALETQALVDSLRYPGLRPG
jgi:cation/acetate symporter